MKRFILLTLAALLTAGAASPLFAEAQPDFNAILVKVDSLNKFEGSDFSAVYTIVSQKPGEERSISEMKLFRKDSDDKMLMLILKPEIQKGQGFLQVSDDAWMYDPSSGKFEHFSMKDNFQDSEAKNSDFKATSLAEDYAITSVTEENLGKIACYVLDLKAKTNDTTYPRIKIWVAKQQSLLLKQESYSLSDRLMRTAYYSAYSKAGGQLIPTKILMMDNVKVGEQSEITIKNISTASIPVNTFTKNYLEQAR